MALYYTLSFDNTATHTFHVSMTIEQPNAQGQIVTLPAWIPGSYMIRDFAKNIVSFKCLNEGKEVNCTLLDKQTWQVDPVIGALDIVYTIYAYDLSVRTAYLDDERAFFNGSSVLLSAKGFENSEHELNIERSSAARSWNVHTTLQAVSVDAAGFGKYCAANYDDLIDHPVEIADAEIGSFVLDDVSHDLIITGHKGSDLSGMVEDLEKICKVHCNLFGGYPKAGKSNVSYKFLTMVVDNGYGGLEHRDSTALLCSRKDLLRQGEKAAGEQRNDYIQFLGLCSHEYFHTWNIKRIKPTPFLDYQLDQEQYTEDLWFYEGVTSYYDDLALVRSGIITTEKYLDLLSCGITRVLRCEGRFQQTVTESSFYAWSKFYKQDENASNAIVSYYSKGAVVALCLDLMIRQNSLQHSSNEQNSLDDLMRALWSRAQQGLGSSTPEIIAEANKLVAQPLNEFFQQALYSTNDLPVSELLAMVGVEMNLRPRSSDADKGGVTKAALPKSFLGIDVQETSGQLSIRVCHANSPAIQAGLSAKDKIVAINGLKASKSMLWQLLLEKSAGEQLVFHVFRRDRLVEVSVDLASPKNDTCSLVLVNESLSKGWLSI